MARQIVMMNEEPHEDHFQSIGYDPTHPKPSGGFWTSSEVEEGESQWTLERAQDSPRKHTWHMQPHENARVLHIDSWEKEEAFRTTYMADIPDDQVSEILANYHLSGLIDWPKVAQEWDGVHYTPGYFCPEFSVFSQWDIESTLWTRWCFEDPVQIGWGKPDLNNVRMRTKEMIDLDSLDSIATDFAKRLHD